MTRAEKLDLLQTLEAKDRKLHAEVFLKKSYSLIQRAYLLCPTKIRLLCGSNRSGKSEAGSDDIIIRATGIIPSELRADYPMPKIRSGNYWCSALTNELSRTVCLSKIFKSFPKARYRFFNKEEKILYTRDGNEIAFKSVEQGRDRYSGVSRLMIWADEEHPEEIWDESYMRTIDCQGDLALTFTPVEGLTWAYKKLYKKASFYYYTKNKHGISEEVGIVHTPEELLRLKERELVILPNTSEETDPDITSFQMTIYDNKFLPDSEIQKTERKYKDDPISYNARVLGRFTKISGRNVFNVNRLIETQQNLNPVFKRGEVINGQFKEMPNGRLVLFRDKKAIDAGYYVIGADVAEGIATGDYNCAQILDRLTCEQVAVWHGHCSPEEFAGVLVDLGRYFNFAFIAPERNFHGFGVVSRIRDHYKYPRLYYDYDQAQTTISQNIKLTKKFGWDTTAKTKPIMIQTLAAFINDKHIRLNDFHTVDELITFVYDKEGSTDAMGGCYDDRVIALAIAVQLFKRTPIVAAQTADQVAQYQPKTAGSMGY